MRAWRTFSILSYSVTFVNTFINQKLFLALSTNRAKNFCYKSKSK